MHECYAIFACVVIRIDLERINLTEHSPLKRQEPASAPSEDGHALLYAKVVAV
jgi:hypothetical protein